MGEKRKIKKKMIPICWGVKRGLLKEIHYRRKREEKRKI